MLLAAPASVRGVDPAELRAAFPLLARVAYLNAGTDGPVADGAVQAASAELARERDEGRTYAHFERRRELADAQREHYAQLLSTEPCNVALTTSTSEGVGIALAGLKLDAGEEVLCAEGEHPGLLGPLQAARDVRGVTLRFSPLAGLAEAVGPQTRLVVCGHVAWRTGELAPVEALAALGEDGPALLYDGAQAVGAIPVDVDELGCAIYAGSGQKWLCGPDGTGMLYVAPAWRERVVPLLRSYTSFADAAKGVDAELHDDCRRFDTPSLPAEASAFAVASLELLASFGWDALYARAAELASELTLRLAKSGHAVAARGDTTLVSWHSHDPTSDKARLADAGIVIRDLPGSDLVRASVGAWNDESDLDRLLRAVG
jgi:selenocysteine lyase/cysteine desulfurase